MLTLLETGKSPTIATFEIREGSLYNLETGKRVDCNLELLSRFQEQGVSTFIVPSELAVGISGDQDSIEEIITASTAIPDHTTLKPLQYPDYDPQYRFWDDLLEARRISPQIRSLYEPIVNSLIQAGTNVHLDVVQGEIRNTMSGVLMSKDEDPINFLANVALHYEFVCKLAEIYGDNSEAISTFFRGGNFLSSASISYRMAKHVLDRAESDLANFHDPKLFITYLGLLKRINPDLFFKSRIRESTGNDPEDFTALEDEAISACDAVFANSSICQFLKFARSNRIEFDDQPRKIDSTRTWGSGEQGEREIDINSFCVCLSLEERDSQPTQLLFKLARKKGLENDQAGVQISEFVGLHTYHIEEYEQSDQNERTWQLIERLPSHSLYDLGENGRKFNRMGPPRRAKIYQDLGRIKALELVFAIYDCDLKHVLFDTEQKRLVRIDWEHGFQRKERYEGNAYAPLDPDNHNKANDLAYFKELEVNPRARKIFLHIFKGFYEALDLLRADLAEGGQVESILRSTMPERADQAIDFARNTLQSSNEEIARSLFQHLESALEFLPGSKHTSPTLLVTKT